MKKTLKKNLILSLIALFVAFVAIATATFTSTPVQAAKRDSLLLSEDFLAEELKADKWTVMTDGTEEDNNIGALVGGLNGTLNIGFSDIWAWNYTLYHDTYVTVKDSEDLVIEYSVVDNNIDLNGSITGIYLLKGLTDPSSTASTKNADAKLESITYGVAQRGHVLTGMGYSRIFGMGTDVGNDNSGAAGIGDSSRSDAVKQYYTDHWDNSLSYPKDDGRHSFSEDIFTTSLDSSVSGAKGILSEGYTFKHVYKATGGYECYVKTNGAADTAYVLWTEIGDTFGFEENDEKRFVARSGYVGFTAYGFGTSFELDFFNVYTVGEDDTVNKVITDSFDTSAQGGRYDDSVWKSSKPQEFKASLIYSEGGFLFNNPSETNYLYTPAVNKIIYDGLYDDYAIVNTAFCIRELTKGKDFGFLFNGTSHMHLLDHNGNVYVYLTYNEGDANYTLGLDYVANGERVNVDTVDSGIPVTNSESDITYKLNIYAKINGTITVEITNEADNVLCEKNFAAADHELYLKDRFAIYTAGDEGSAVVLMRKYDIYNKYYYNFPLGESMSVSENFEGVDADGNILLHDGVQLWIGESSKAVPDPGVFIENGAVHLKGVGHGSGVSVDYSYSSFELYFDIVDMQREKIIDQETGSVIMPLSTAQILVQFGTSTSLLPATDGNMLAITTPLTKPLSDPDIANADYNPDANTWVAIHESGKAPTDLNGTTYLRHNFLDPALDGKTIRIKVVYKDSYISFSYVVVGEEDYSLLDKPIFTYYMEGGEGYVSISSTHNPQTAWCANFTMDNFRVVDTNPFSTIKTPVVEVAPQTGNTSGGSSDNGGCNSVLSGAFGVGFAILTTGTTMAVVRKKNVKKETAEDHE